MVTARQYARALFEAVHNKPAREQGKITDAFLQRVRARGHQALLPRIVTHITLLQEHEQGPVLTVAKKSDTTIAKQSANTPKDVRVEVDPALIGGYIFEAGYQRTDASYKRSLIELYRNITT